MNREQAELLISKALDDEITVSERDALDRYLQEHPELKELQQTWQEYGRLMQEAAKETASYIVVEDAWADIQQRIQKDAEQEELESVDKNLITFDWRALSAVAAMVVLLFSLLTFFEQKDTESLIGNEVAQAVNVEIEYVETDIPGASSIVYVDDESGWTVVWVVEPEEEDLEAI